MKIQVIDVIENKDGSADLVFNYDKEALQFLVQEGINAVLMKMLKMDKTAADGAKMRKRIAKKEAKK